jgi:hypothetical protein
MGSSSLLNNKAFNRISAEFANFTTNDKVKQEFNDLGMFSYGDYSPRVLGVWYLYEDLRGPAPQYRWISKNENKLLCYGPLQSEFLSVLTTEQMISVEGLITNIQHIVNAPPLTGSLISTEKYSSKYYANYTNHNFAYDVPTYPFRAYLNEVVFDFNNLGTENETFTESINIRTCKSQNSSPQDNPVITNNTLTTSELQPFFGPDAEYFKLFSVFKGTLKNKINVTQDHISDIAGKYQANLPLLPWTKMNTPSVIHDYNQYLSPYRLGSVAATAEFGGVPIDKIMAGSYVNSFSENCPADSYLTTIFYGLVTPPDTFATAPINVQELLSSEGYQRIIAFVMNPLYGTEINLGLSIIHGTFASYASMYKAGTVTPNADTIAAAKTFPNYEKIRKDWFNTTRDNKFSDIWNILQESKENINEASTNIGPKVKTSDWYEFLWAVHSEAVIMLLGLAPKEIYIEGNTTFYELHNEIVNNKNYWGNPATGQGTAIVAAVIAKGNGPNPSSYV